MSSTAVNAQSLTLPSGDAKIGDKQFIVRVNAMAATIEALNRLPIGRSAPPPSIWTWRMSATAGPCSRTSCTPTAAGRCC